MCLRQAIVTNAGILQPIVSLGPAESLAVSSATPLTTSNLGSDLSLQTPERRLRPLTCESVGGPAVTLVPANVPALSSTAPAEMPAANLQAVKVEEGEQDRQGWHDKSAPLEPRRPVSAYALFFRDTQAAIKGQNAHVTFRDVSRIVASMWESLAAEQKQVYKDKTEMAKKEYFKALAVYRASQQESGLLIISSQQPCPTASPQQPHPTASPQQLHPTASPQQLHPTTSPQQPHPTASPQQLYPTASPQQLHMTTYPQQPCPPSPHPFSLPHAHTPIILFSSQSKHLQSPRMFLNAATSHSAVVNTSPASCPAQALVMTGGSTGLSREHPSVLVRITNPEDQIREPGSPKEPRASVIDHVMESEETKSLFEEIETFDFEEQYDEEDQEEELEDQTPAAQVSPVRLSTTDNRCQRAGCDRLAVTSPEWDEEYCSCECVVAHCSAVFAAWVEERTKASPRLEQPA